MRAAPAPDVQALLDELASQPTVHFRDMSPEDARAAVAEIVRMLDAPGDPSVTTADYRCPGVEGPDVPVRCYHSESVNEDGPILLFFHGGGWVTGDIGVYDSLCRFIAVKSSLRVVSVDYRRAPEARFPAAYEDAVRVAEWLLDNRSPVPCTHGLVVAGDSAGGGLAAALAQSLKSQASAVRAQLLLYPVLDIARRSHSYLENAEGYLLEATDMEHFIHQYAPDSSQREDPRCSPLLAASMDGLAPLIIVTCGLDVLRDEGRAYAARCAQSGVNVHFVEAAGHIHGLATFRAAIPSGCGVVAQALSVLAGALNETNLQVLRE